MADAPPRGEQEEVLRRLEEEVRKLRISDVLVQTAYTVSQLAWHRLQPGETQDLAQARLGIEALRALQPVLAEAVPEQGRRDLQQALASLQLAYAGSATPAAPAREEPAREEPLPGDEPPAEPISES